MYSGDFYDPSPRGIIFPGNGWYIGVVSAIIRHAEERKFNFASQGHHLGVPLTSTRPLDRLKTAKFPLVIASSIQNRPVTHRIRIPVNGDSLTTVSCAGIFSDFDLP